MVGSQTLATDFKGPRLQRTEIPGHLFPRLIMCGLLNHREGQTRRHALYHVTRLPWGPQRLSPRQSYQANNDFGAKFLPTDTPPFSTPPQPAALVRPMYFSGLCRLTSSASPTRTNTRLGEQPCPFLRVLWQDLAVALSQTSS